MMMSKVWFTCFDSKIKKKPANFAVWSKKTASVWSKKTASVRPTTTAPVMRTLIQVGFVVFSVSTCWCLLSTAPAWYCVAPKTGEGLAMGWRIDSVWCHCHKPQWVAHLSVHLPYTPPPTSVPRILYNHDRNKKGFCSANVCGTWLSFFVVVQVIMLDFQDSKFC